MMPDTKKSLESLGQFLAAIQENPNAENVRLKFTDIVTVCAALRKADRENREFRTVLDAWYQLHSKGILVPAADQPWNAKQMENMSKATKLLLEATPDVTPASVIFTEKNSGG